MTGAGQKKYSLRHGGLQDALVEATIDVGKTAVVGNPGSRATVETLLTPNLRPAQHLDFLNQEGHGPFTGRCGLLTH
jgi:hypothetical protein